MRLDGRKLIDKLSNKMKGHSLKKIIIGMLFIFLTACAATGGKTESAVNNETQNEQTDIPLSERIYFLQHKLIAEWMFESEGDFYADLIEGNNDKFFEVAAEIVNPEYAIGIVVTPMIESGVVLFSFPTPLTSPNCYFSIIKKEATGFSYYTYEKTLDYGEKEFIAVVGGWDEDGSHMNFGIRNYQTGQDFVTDILGDK